MNSSAGISDGSLKPVRSSYAGRKPARETESSSLASRGKAWRRTGGTSSRKGTNASSRRWWGDLVIGSGYEKDDEWRG